MSTALVTTHTLFRAFADATRLRLLNLLCERELCVCELCELLDIDQPKISRHLAYLRRAGLVTVRKEGKWKYYAVLKRPAGLHRTLLQCVRSCLREIDTLQEDLDRLRATRLHAVCR
jgi:ArsR family transcriptional regulator